MTLYLAAWIVLAVIAGLAAARARPETDDDAMAAVWTGIIAMVLVLGSLTVLMAPVWAWGFAVVLAVGSLLVGPGLDARLSILSVGRISLWGIVVFLGLGAALAYDASRFPIYFDTAFYHLQMARIAAEFGVLEGAALLHPNFGQVSLWFPAAAAFLVGGDAALGLGFLNGLFAFLAAGHALVALHGIVVGGRRDLAAALPAVAFPILLLLALRWDMIASLSPDFPVMVLVVVIGWTLCLEKRHWGLAILATTVACLIKVSAAPLAVVVGVWVLMGLWRTPKRLIGWTAVVAAAVGCFIHASVAASGCAVYPVAFTCIDFPWAISDAAVDAHAALISSAAFGGGRVLTESIGPLEWLWLFADRDTSGAVVVLLFLIAIGVAAARATTRRSWVFRLAALGGIFVLLTAPTGRFLVGYATVAAGILAPAMLQIIDRAGSRSRVASTMIALVLFCGSLTVALMTGPGADLRAELRDRHWPSGAQARMEGLLAPMPVLAFDILASPPYALARFEVRSNGFVDLIGPASDSECWAVAPPCALRGVPESLRFADPKKGVGAGFRAADGS